MLFLKPRRSLIALTLLIILSATLNVSGREFEPTWLDAGIPDTSWYGDGSAQTFTLETAQQLAGLAQLMNEPNAMQRTDGFKDRVIILNADIDLSGRRWIPIGEDVRFEGVFFKGSLFGNAHTISGLTIHSDTVAGLFNRLDNATIEGVILDQVSVQGKTRVGAIASEAIDSILNDVHVRGQVQAVNDGSNTSEVVGGLLGILSSGIIIDSSFTGEVSGDAFVGGLLGLAVRSDEDPNYTLITHSHFSGTLRAKQQAGGLVGTSINGVGVYDTSVRADIFVEEYIAGGLIGGGYGAVFDEVIFEGRIEANAYIGGIAGIIENGAVRIAQIQATLIGRNAQSSEIGGVAGYAFESSMSELKIEGEISGYQNVGGVVGLGENISIDVFEVRTSLQATQLAGALAGLLMRSEVWNGKLTETTLNSNLNSPLIGSSNNNTLVNIEYNELDSAATSRSSNPVALVVGGLVIAVALSVAWLSFIKKKRKT